jgi:hypothetical protein
VKVASEQPKHRPLPSIRCTHEEPTMSVTERERHAMIEALQDKLGTEPAMTLVEHLPPGGWSDVARQADIAEVRGDVTVLRGEVGVLRGEVGELRGEVGELRGEVGELRGEVGELRGDLRSFEERMQHGFAMAEERAEKFEYKILGYVDRRTTEMTRLLFFAIIGALAANTGGVAAALALTR